MKHLTQKTTTINISQPLNTPVAGLPPATTEPATSLEHGGEKSGENVPKEQLITEDEPEKSDHVSSAMTAPIQQVAMTTAPVEEDIEQDLPSRDKLSNHPITDEPDTDNKHGNQPTLEDSALQLATSNQSTDTASSVSDMLSVPTEVPTSQSPSVKDPHLVVNSEQSDSQDKPSNTEEEEVKPKLSEEVTLKPLEEVKSKPAELKSSTDEGVASETEPVSKKRNFHITALSVVSFPVARLPVLSTVTPEAPTTVLITGITVFRDGKFIPVLMSHKIAYLKKRGQRKSQKPPSTVHLPSLPDPLDDYMYMDVSYVAPSSSWEAPSKPSTDSPTLPATLGFGQSFILEGDFGSGGLPEIKQIIPLNGGKLLAVTCRVSSSVSLFEQDGNNSQTTTVFLLSLNKDGLISADSLRKIPVDEAIVCICAVSKDTPDTPSTIESSSNNPALLAVLFKTGQVTIYDCNEHALTVVTSYDCPVVADSSLELVDCVYSPATRHLAVASREGRVWLLKLNMQGTRSKDSGELETLKQGESRILGCALSRSCMLQYI